MSAERSEAKSAKRSFASNIPNLKFLTRSFASRIYFSTNFVIFGQKAQKKINHNFIKIYSIPQEDSLLHHEYSNSTIWFLEDIGIISNLQHEQWLRCFNIATIGNILAFLHQNRDSLLFSCIIFILEAIYSFSTLQWMSLDHILVMKS